MDAAFEALPGNGPGAHEAWATEPRHPAAHEPAPRLNDIKSAERGAASPEHGVRIDLELRF